MYDPNNPAHVGPQITARPGTERHIRQTIARAKFFAVMYVSQRAETRRLQAKLEAKTAEFLNAVPPSGHA